MTSRNINFFSLIACGCIALLFVRNVYSYPHKEFEFPNSFENSGSNEDETEQPVIHTTAGTVPITGNQLEISNINATNVHDINLRTQIEQRQLHEQRQNSDTIVFPTERIPDQLIVPSITDKPQGPELHCKESTLCENVSYYPEEMINKLIQQNDSIKYLATVDVLPDIVERFNTNEKPLCESYSQILYPREGMTKEKLKLTIVNQENLTQGVRVETCVNENNECSIAGSLSGGYKTLCVQKYIDRKLVAVTRSNDIGQEVFRIPSGCCCHQIFTGNALERFGIGIKQGSQTTTIKNQRK